MAPIVDRIEDPSLAARDGFKGKGSRGGAGRPPALKREEHRDRILGFATTAALLLSDPMVNMSASARSDMSRPRR